MSYRILSSIVCTFFIENDAEVFSAHYTLKVSEKGFKMALMKNKLAMIMSITSRSSSLKPPNYGLNLFTYFTDGS